VRGRSRLGLALLAALVPLAASCATFAVGRAPAPGAPPAPGPPARAGAPAPTVAGPFRLDREPTLDVGLAWDLTSATLELPRGADLVRVGGSGTLEREHAAAGTLAASVEGGRLAWRAGRLRGDGAAGETLFVGGDGARSEGDPFRIRWNGKTWRGPFKLFVGPRGGLAVAARLGLETYLEGVVPGEIGGLAEDRLEAGRAQAIAARSYTLFYRGRRGAEGFDLYGTVEDQLYGPVESERPLATRCVTATRGRVALSAGQPIRANYCSTCGGITAEVWEAWPTASVPYLVSHLDHGSGDYCAASPQYRWREEWPAAEFAADLGRFGPPLGVPLPPVGVGEIVDVAVAQRSRSGRVWRLAVTTTTGTITIPAYALRQVLRRPGSATAILRSNLFKVDVRRDPATRRALAVIASGAGAGHGVGLCQTGAVGMALAGHGADQILAHYYPGVEIRRLYD
jgi:stage II sporulation protein D